MADHNFPYQQMRPELNLAFIAVVQDKWALYGTPLAIDDLGGAYNRNWRVVMPADDVVVRVRPPWLRAQRVAELHALLMLLNREALPTPKLRHSRFGRTYEYIQGRLVEGYDYLVEKSNPPPPVHP